MRSRSKAILFVAVLAVVATTAIVITGRPAAPDVLLGTVLAAGFYVAGVLRRPGRAAAGSWRRHASFFGGLAGGIPESAPMLRSRNRSLAIKLFAVSFAALRASSR